MHVSVRTMRRPCQSKLQGRLVPGPKRSQLEQPTPKPDFKQVGDELCPCEKHSMANSCDRGQAPFALIVSCLAKRGKLHHERVGPTKLAQIKAEL